MEKLKIVSSFFDPCFLYRKFNEILTLITGLATDDCISTCSTEYKTSEEIFTESFFTRKSTALPFRFVGTLI